ncbi:MAG: 5-methyltetrahydropteroyltriglutamate--homocysteine S-methyltransferase [Pseudozobellia sp.]|nr:5-methyltetrahydropteroyltriglutamate--homocysteine S-methyltransferase [Pseudozobellia sp.]
MMKSIVLGYPRIGANRELKKITEKYWRGDATEDELLRVGRQIKSENWKLQHDLGVDLISSNDFSLYDQVLEMCTTLGCIPQRFEHLDGLHQYFAMARGLQNKEVDVTAMEMTKWFDTNYHYIVPEFTSETKFRMNPDKILGEIKEAKKLGIQTKPVIIGPVTFLLLGKEKEDGFNRLDLLSSLLPCYQELLELISNEGVEFVQIDEPILAKDLSGEEQLAIKKSYSFFANNSTKLKIILANYFDCYGANLNLALDLPVQVLHLDLVRCRLQLDDILAHPLFNGNKILSLGLVDGRNIWKNDYEQSLRLVEKAKEKLDSSQIWIGTSCSLLHSPVNLELESNNEKIPHEVKQWLAFAEQKLGEVIDLTTLANGEEGTIIRERLSDNKRVHSLKRSSKLVHNGEVKKRLKNLKESDSQRKSPFTQRQLEQRNHLRLPLYPTTTIGSFPQTKEVRIQRRKFKKNELSSKAYDEFLFNETHEAIKFQEAIGLDVLVHGEFERNDMVEYFGEHLSGFAFTQFGWVQSYGTRCVKPPIIYGDVSRPKPMTVKWSSVAQSLTKKHVKGMLTGPVTILQWSFVRNDQPRSATCNQIALAIRDEVCDLEKAGIKIIQIDEPAIREGLPLRKEDWGTYLNWAIKAFRISASGVDDSTQIHTHMCYSEFNDIIDDIAEMDADVITIETSRSEMELLQAFVDFKYPNEIGPGVYDIHSPRVPTTEEIENLLERASELLPIENIWVNPDCGLKTRDWPETKLALENMVRAAQKLRQKQLQSV